MKNFYLLIVVYLILPNGLRAEERYENRLGSVYDRHTGTTVSNSGTASPRPRLQDNDLPLTPELLRTRTVAMHLNEESRRLLAAPIGEQDHLRWRFYDINGNDYCFFYDESQNMRTPRNNRRFPSGNLRVTGISQSFKGPLTSETEPVERTALEINFGSGKVLLCFKPGHGRSLVELMRVNRRVVLGTE